MVDYNSHMIGLVDCNNFYANCERVFRPDLIGVPIAVLSNNDGCVIARSNELKELGIKMGIPYYQMKELERKHKIAVFSSNYELYGDMSNRVMTLLSSYVPETEVYSIDEAFLNFDGFETYFNLKEYGEKIVKEVTRGTGIPVSLGIAPTKTLAKVANKYAKKYKGYKGCCVIDSEEKRIKALKGFEVGDVWGIGHRNEKKLKKYGIHTAYDFACAPPQWIRLNFTVVGLRTWKELNGEPCIEMDVVPPPKKSICTSRAFGEYVTNFDGMKEAISTFTSVCAQKLRKQGSCATSLLVFIHTNNFNEKHDQYAANIPIRLPVPSNITPELVGYAIEGLRLIFKEGYKYKKAGVIILETTPEIAVQQNMFDTYNREKNQKVMPILDKLNSGFNKNTIMLACQLGKEDWRMKQIHRSPCYSTKVSDFIHVKTA